MSSEASRNPITAEMKAGIRRDLPEIGDIADKALSAKVVDAWALALSETRYKAISEVPPWGNPKVFVIKRGSQAQHRAKDREPVALPTSPLPP